MLNHCQILVTRLVLGISVANLSACGQQGALYLPAETATAKHAPASDSGAAKSAVPASSSKQP
jgi:predicted small lipoprotein YifL